MLWFQCFTFQPAREGFGKNGDGKGELFWEGELYYKATSPNITTMIKSEGGGIKKSPKTPCLILQLKKKLLAEYNRLQLGGS